MASRLKNISALFEDSKSRTIIIFTGLILITGLVVALISFRSGPAGPTAKASITRPPKIKGQPGYSAPSKVYEQAQVQASQQRSQQAARTGTSSIPTVTGTPGKPGEAGVAGTGIDPGGPLASRFGASGGANSKAALQALLGKGASGAAGGTADSKRLQQQLAQQKKALLVAQQAQTRLAQQRAAEQAAAEKIRRQQALQQARQAARTRAEAAAQAARQKQQTIQKSMSGYLKAQFNVWVDTPTQYYQQGIQDKKGKDGTAGSGKKGKKNTGPVINVKAGDIIFAVLDTKVNSDEPGPVLATVVSGALKGAKLIGGIKLMKEAKRVKLTFSQMSLAYLPKSVGIKAIAIDPKSARTAIATGVNSHYLLRYGSLLGSAFLAGYGQAVASEGSVIIDKSDGSTTSTTDSKTSSDLFSIALGNVGTSLASNLNVFNTAPTVTVKSGTGIGILFTSDSEVPVKKKSDKIINVS